MTTEGKYKLIIFAILIITGVLAASWSITFIGPRAPEREPPILFPVKTVVTSISLVSSFLLLIIYGKILRIKRTRFTAGLLLVAGALFFSSFVSNPIIDWVLGWRFFGFGEIVVSSSIFTCIATLSLLYVSIE